MLLAYIEKMYLYIKTHNMDINITLNNSDKIRYEQICLNHLKVLFEVRDAPYTEKETVKQACQECITVLVKEFENESSNIRTTTDVEFFLCTYSETGVNKDTYPYEERVIYQKMCRYLFGEFTKLNLRYDENISFDNSLISRLYYITMLITNYAQLLYQCYIEEGDVFQLELYDQFFGITMINSDYEQIYNKVEKLTKTNCLSGDCIGFIEVEKFIQQIESSFGHSAKEYIDVVYVGANNPIEVIDLTNLVLSFGDDSFLEGLTLRQANIDMTRSVHKPHTINLRTRYRPIIEVYINGSVNYISTPYIANEALSEFVTNQIPFGIIPDEWKTNKAICNYAKQQQQIHDKWLEDPVEKIIVDRSYLFLRNRKSINNINLEKEETRDKGKFVGEIDFIVANQSKAVLYVIDCKFIKTKFDFASFLVDKNTFAKDNGYNIKLSYKVEWVTQHLPEVSKELGLDVSSFAVHALFITDTFVYYSINSPFPIIPLKWIENYFDTGE